MKALIVQTAFLILATSVAAQAQSSSGGFFLEPAVTYELGNTTTTYPSPFSNATGTSNGLGFGGRLGFHLNDMFFLGVDGRYATTDFKDSSVSYDAKAISTNWGPVVGLQMPTAGMRLWGGYIINSELNPESSGSIDVKLSQGTGYRLGTGFHLAAVSLNLEYQEIKYTSATLEKVGPFTAGTFNDVNMTNKTWLASVSFPLSL